MAAVQAITVEDHAPSPGAGERRFASILLGNRKFVWGSAIFLAITLTAMIGGLGIYRRRPPHRRRSAPARSQARTGS